MICTNISDVYSDKYIKASKKYYYFMINIAFLSEYIIIYMSVTIL